MTKENGGAAFPHLNPNYDGNWDKEPQRAGMTLRDWFAGQALAGILANPVTIHGQDGLGSPMLPDQVAADAYATADAMLRMR